MRSGRDAASRFFRLLSVKTVSIKVVNNPLQHDPLRRSTVTNKSRNHPNSFVDIVPRPIFIMIKIIL